MESKHIPEQRIMRFLAYIVAVVFVWPIIVASLYAMSDRYGKAKIDDVADVFLVIVTIIAQFSWFFFLGWLILEPGGLG